MIIGDFFKQSSVGESLITQGRAFHNHGAKTENARPPIDFHLNEGC